MENLFGLCSGPMNLLGPGFSVIGLISVTATWLIRTLSPLVYPSIPPLPLPSLIRHISLKEDKERKKLEHEVWPLNPAQDKTHCTVGKKKAFLTIHALDGVSYCRTISTRSIFNNYSTSARWI